MRFLEFTALAAGLVAAVPQQPGGYGPMTSATTTQYTTITVFRVETTVTATRNGTIATYESTSTETSAMAAPTAPTAPTAPYATGSLPGYGNNTSIIPGTGALPSATYSGPPSTGAAGKFGVEAFSLAAVVGAVGLLLV